MDHGIAASIQEATRLVELAPGVFVTANTTEGQGGNRRVGFGGCTIGVGVRAACATVDTVAFKLYSCLGNFLGPASGFKPLHARVTPLRSTRTFATRRVDLLQDQDDDDGDGASGVGGEGGEGPLNASSSLPSSTTQKKKKQPPRQRLVMTLTADFMREEPRSLLEYSAPMRKAWSGPEESLGFTEALERARAEGALNDEGIERVKVMHAGALPKFERRSAPEGWYGQTCANLVVPDRVPMDELPPTEKGTAEWYRLYRPCENYVDTIVSLAFILDAGIAHQVVFWSRIDPNEVAAVSSLEFALRFFVNDYVWDKGFLLREESPREAGVGRTYKEALMRKADGSVLASMTQQCILRARPKGNNKL